MFSSCDCVLNGGGEIISNALMSERFSLCKFIDGGCNFPSRITRRGHAFRLIGDIKSIRLEEFAMMV